MVKSSLSYSSSSSPSRSRSPSSVSQLVLTPSLDLPFVLYFVFVSSVTFGQRQPYWGDNNNNENNKDTDNNYNPCNLISCRCWLTAHCPATTTSRLLSVCLCFCFWSMRVVEFITSLRILFVCVRLLSSVGRRVGVYCDVKLLATATTNCCLT